MKCILSVIAFFLLYISQAQNEKFGVVGGANLSNVLGDFNEITASKRRLSYHIGVFADYKITDKLTFFPQINFSSQGFREKGVDTFPVIDFENGNPFQGTTTISSDGAYIYTYLSVPLEFRYAILDNIDVILGPQVGYIINARYKGDFTEEGVTEEENFTYDFKPKMDYRGDTRTVLWAFK